VQAAQPVPPGVHALRDRRRAVGAEYELRRLDLDLEREPPAVRWRPVGALEALAQLVHRGDLGRRGDLGQRDQEVEWGIAGFEEGVKEGSDCADRTAPGLRFQA